ncbi:MAG: hypothetical protein ACE5GT_15005, partial [Rhodospirillales bacterium]
ENKAKNRRVAIRVYPMSLDQKEAFLRKLELRDLEKGAAAAEQMKAGGANAPEGAIGQGTGEPPTPPAGEPGSRSPGGQ